MTNDSGSLCSDLSVVVPSYDGLHLLHASLPSVLAAAARYREKTGAATEIVVVDDGSRDETTSRLPEAFPEVRIVARASNGGFAAACNSGFEVCRFPVVGLLNNDVTIEPDYFDHSCAHFADSRVFGVTARIFEGERPLFATGGKVGRFRKGFWSVYRNYDVSSAEGRRWVEKRRLPSIYAVGGFATFRRSMLEELGGFCELLSPFYWEDIDLSYRAWKRGWEVRYEPRSVGYHRTSSTIGTRFQRRLVQKVSLRNRLLFHWINLHSPSLWAAHLGMLGLLAASRFLVLDFDFYRALGSALSRTGRVWRLRRAERAAACRSDVDLVAMMQRLQAEAPIEVYHDQEEVARRHPQASLG